MEGTAPVRCPTLDGQLVDYWSREAARLDVLASQARFGWQRRRFERKAEKARAQSERSRAREAQRGRTGEHAVAGLSQG